MAMEEREAWCAGHQKPGVHRVAKSQTGFSDWISAIIMHFIKISHILHINGIVITLLYINV